MLLTSHSGVGLFWLTSPTNLLPYKISFLLSQTDVKKSPTLLHHEIHSLFINVPWFSPKQNSSSENAAVIKSFECFLSKDLLHIVKKVLSLGIIWCTLKKNMLNRLLTSPTIRTFLRPTPLSMPTQLLRKSMGTWTKLRKQPRRGSLYVFQNSFYCDVK